MKQNIIDSIIAGFNQLKLEFDRGNDSDISINTVFLDAGWGSGNKKITYQAKVTADEATETVYMWEFTKEEGSGFGFSSDSETSFQSGKTLFRKVKSAQFGPDGKAYEMTLDLGAISKTVKEAAKRSGWKFKTVLKKEKAMYGPGVVSKQTIDQGSFPIENEAESFPKETVKTNPVIALNHDKPLKPKGGSNILFWLVFVFSGIMTLMLFATSKTSLVGWVIAGVLLVALFIYRNKFALSGCLIKIVIWIVSVILLFLIYAFTTDFDSVKKEGKGAANVTATDSGKNSSQGKTPFSILQYMVTQIAIDDVDYVKKTSSKYIFASFIITINKDEIGSGDQLVIKSLKANNFKVIKKGSGNVSFYKAMGKDNSFDYRKRSGFEIDKEFAAKEVSQADLMSLLGESGFVKAEGASGYVGSLEFICVVDTKPTAIKEDSNSATPEEILEILKPATISFDVVVENEAGEKFVKSYTQELFTKNQVLNSEVINNMQPEPMFKK